VKILAFIFLLFSLPSLAQQPDILLLTGALDNQIFVSKYMLQLPDEKTLLNFINREKRHLLAISEPKKRKK
jgi:hypothetical protein